MSTLLVTYDLNQPGQNYDGLIKFLKSHSSWCRPLESTWLVVTSQSTAQLRDEINKHIDPNDETLVINVSNDGWASFNLSKEVTDWLHSNL